MIVIQIISSNPGILRKFVFSFLNYEFLNFGKNFFLFFEISSKIFTRKGEKRPVKFLFFQSRQHL